MKLIIKFWFVLNVVLMHAQMPSSRITDWRHAGKIEMINNRQILNFDSIGGSTKKGFSNDTVFKKALSLLAKNGGTIQFGSGQYVFDNTLTLSDSITLKGVGASTILAFNLKGANKNCIAILGQLAPRKYSFLGGNSGTYQLAFDPKNMPEANAIIQIFHNDSSLASSSWALGCIGQICRTSQSDTNRGVLTSTTPLRIKIKKESATYARALKPIQNVTIECLKIVRLDSTINQTHNIHFNYAFNCMVKGVESENCNFGHVVFENSCHNSVLQSYFHHAFAYGGNGQGYGVVFQNTSGDNLVENSIFNHLRHSILVQSGANGNVSAYNYSVDPYWSDNAFKDAAGDLVCHGNFAHHNLFEGNICQNIIVDNSHGKNGPFNTFLRNRAALYGLIVSSNQDSQNFISNEITNPGLLMGQFILTGNGHINSNNNVKNKLQSNITLTIPDTSFYLSQKPAFIPPQCNWPILGYPQPFNNGQNGAIIRYKESSEKAYCETIVYSSKINTNNFNSNSFNCYPNPFNSKLLISATEPITIKLFNSFGSSLMEIKINDYVALETADLPNGIYFITSGNTFSMKLVKISTHGN